MNAYAAQSAEITGKLTTIFLLQCVSLKRAFLVAFSISAIGLILLMIFSHSEGWIPMMLLITRFGFS